ncbi:phage major tail tube protein [Rhizobium sp. SU303]|uniref:phage major tail tube protein n=1 Tax=Rhizobium sp. SU303 TaxID=3138065 RepID=UPI001E389D74|nr:phage major tail tube protein [Rhizobium leguminosarum]UFW80029.1 phage major tail tube protein [Rhizobium leguminosarum bv. viciae]
MAESNKPRSIMRDCTLWADRESKLGQIGDITLPVVQKKLEELRNGGMIKPRDIMLGYEKLGFSFKMPGLDPQIVKLFGLKPGVETPFIITGALVDEDGTVHSAVATVRGSINQLDHGNWKPGELSENDNTVSVNYYKLEIDGEELIEMDDFDVKIGGVSQYQGIRNALLL